MAWSTTIDLDDRLEKGKELFFPLEETLDNAQRLEFNKLCVQAQGVRSKLVDVSWDLEGMLNKKKKEHKQILVLTFVLSVVTWLALVSGVIGELRSGLAIAGMLSAFAYFEIKRAIELNAAKVTYHLLASDWLALGQTEESIKAAANAWSAASDKESGVRGLILDLDMKLNLLKVIGVGERIDRLEPIWKQTLKELMNKF